MLVQKLHRTVVEESADTEVTAQSHAFALWRKYMKSTCGKEITSWEPIKVDDLIVTA